MRIKWKSMDWRLLVIVIVWSLPAIGIMRLCSSWQQSLAAIATWFLALGVFFAWSQVKQGRRSTKAQLAVELFQELRSDETMRTLRYVYSHSPEELAKACGINRHDVDSLLDRLELLATLVIHEVVEEKLAATVSIHRRCADEARKTVL